MNVAVLRKICKKLKFEVQKGFYRCPLAQLDKIFNGCGPDWLPEYFRKKLSRYFRFFMSAFLAHDFSFELSDRTRKGFKKANKKMYRNCKRLIEARYSWWQNPIMKARRHWQAWGIYRICVRFGWSAWMD